MSKIRRKHKVLSLILLAVLGLLLVLSSASYGLAKDDLDLTPAQAVAVSSNKVIEPKDAIGPANYIIQLVGPPVASYRGGIKGLAATSPTVTGARWLDVNSPASVAYRNYLNGAQADLMTAMRQALGHPVNAIRAYQYVFNGIAVRLTPEEAATIARLPNVRKVFRETFEVPLTDAGPAWIGASGIWDGSASGSVATKGEGVVVAILDSGINHDHPSFAAVAGDGYAHTNPLGSGNFIPDSYCDTDDPDFCNDKLIGAWSFVSEAVTPEDSNGHGSHTASTVAGNEVEATLVAPTTSFTDGISGVAPRANIIAYDVCVETCPTIASLAAVEQVVIDSAALPSGIAAINYSISGGSDPFNDAIELAFLAATDAGIFVSTSAGNAGPDAATVAHLSPWVATVGAGTHNRQFRNSLVNLTGGVTSPPGDIQGLSFTSGYGPAEIVYAGDFGDPLCPIGAFPPGTFNGEIVICDRGIHARVDKAQSVSDGGAGGFVLANDAPNGNSLVGDAYVLPGVHITFDDGVTLKAWVDDGGSSHVGTITGITPNYDPANGDVMAAFSSRGPGTAFDVLKPDVTAPGVDIWAALATDGTAPSPEYGFMSGTSMSSPHNAGAAALMAAVHPDWSPHEIKSALMTTALTDGVLKEDGTTAADPFDMGSGRVDLSVAALAGLVLDETTANFEAADPDLGGDVKTLNIASLYDGSCLQVCSWIRTVSSTLSTSETWTASVAAPAGVVLSVSPDSFTIPAGGTQAIEVTADVSGAAAGDWLFGEITLSASGSSPDAHFPVAVMATTGVLPDVVEINTRRDAGSQLVEDLEAVEITELTIEVDGLTEGSFETQSLSQDPTNDDPYDNLNDGTTFYVNVSVPAGAPRLVAEITASEAPDIDLYVGTGSVPDAATELCTSTTPFSDEYCNLDNPTPGTWWILVQNWAESASPPDEVTLSYAVVPDGDNGNMHVEGPMSVPERDPFDLRVFWHEPAIEAGDRWYGSFSIGTDPGHPGNVGTIDVNLVRHGDDVTKTVSSTTASPGNILTYTITVEPNVTPTDLTYVLTDTIPTGLTYVPGTASATDGIVTVVDNQILWTGVMEVPAVTYAVATSDMDPGCIAPLATDGAYVNLEAYGILAAPAIFGDDIWFSVDFDGGEFNFFGADQGELVNFTDDGFAFFDPSTPGSMPSVHRPIPTASDPNNLMAIFWRNFEVVYDEATNRGVSLANLTSGGVPVAAVIEYDDVEDWPAGSNPTYDFEIIAYYDASDAPGAYEYIFAYDNLTGPVSTGTIGLENVDGSAGVEYAFDDIAVTDGMAVCFDLVGGEADPVTITYQATVDAGTVGQTLTNNVVHNTDNPGSMESSTSVDVLILSGANLFYAIMRGQNEVPPVPSNMRGNAWFLYHGTSTEFRLHVTGHEDTTAGHIHCAPEGVNGPVGVTLFTGSPFSARGNLRGSFTEPDPENDCGWLTLEDVVAALSSGNAYVNIHTVEYPSGEIRGQIEAFRPILQEGNSR